MDSKGKRIDAYIISWTGRHQDAIDIAGNVYPFADSTTIIYSDVDENMELNSSPASVLKVPNAWYWGKKFQTCIQHFQEDILLIIHADVRCDDWPGLINRCRDCYTRHPDIGVYSPEIDYTHWSLDKTALGTISGENLTKVVQTDGIVFALSQRVTNRLKQLDYEQNIYGWGIDWAAMAYCYTYGLMAVVDTSIKIHHPKSTGYNSTEAKRQELLFLAQLTEEEKQTLHSLRSHVVALEQANIKLKDATLMTISLDLGSGPEPKNPFKASQVLGLDLEAYNDKVKVCQLGFEPLPYQDSSFDFCSAYDLIEHIPRLGGEPPNRNPFIFLMSEIWRILKPKGRFYAQTPAYPYPTAFSDPTHVNIITSDTVLYFGTHVTGDGVRMDDNRKELGKRYGFVGDFNILRNYSNQAYGHQIWLLEAVK